MGPGPGQSYEDAERLGLVAREYAVRVEGSSVPTDRGDRTVRVVFTVTNTGEKHDEYRLEVLPQRLVVVDGPVETLSLDAAASATVSVTVGLRSGSPEPSLMLRATSHGNPNVVDEATVTQF